MSLKDSISGLWSRAFGPKLRCKPGDICMIVKQYEGRFLGESVKLPDQLGIVVRVLSHDGYTWSFEDPLEVRIDIGGHMVGFTIYGLGDEFLQPLPKLDEPAEEVSHPAHRDYGIRVPA